MNNITMKMNADELILLALREDITSEDITTNSVMPHYQAGEVDLICKQDGVIAGLDVFKRVFELLDEKTEVLFYCLRRPSGGLLFCERKEEKEVLLQVAKGKKIAYNGGNA